MSEVGKSSIDERCVGCSHPFKFHIDASGTLQPCDYDIGAGMEDISDIPVLCGCDEFVQQLN